MKKLSNILREAYKSNATDKFILHVVHSMFPLNEYSEGTLNKILKHYRDEADDLGIEISDDKLKKYVKRFDDIKASLIRKGTSTDIVKPGTGGKLEVILPLSKLIKAVTASAGDETEEEVPGAVYQEGGLTVWNGSTEGNCILYGQGERWCITRGSFKTYRYDPSRKLPTFYLVRDTNLPDSDPKSFFVVVVGSDNTYKVSDRTNNDYGHGQTEWQVWEPWSFVEQNFPSIRGLKDVFKYIPLTPAEKVTQLYKDKELTVREWMNLPFNVKTQYLVIRKGKKLFSDIDNTIFIEKYLPKYPQIANFIAQNEGIIKDLILLKYLDKFSNQDTRSIIANMRAPVDLEYLTYDSIPFEVKKFLVKFNKWELPDITKLFVTQDGSTIVSITTTIDDEREPIIKMGLYREDDDYPDVKINKRTAKYLLEYPNLDDLPIEVLSKLVEDGIIEPEKVVAAFNNLEDTPSGKTIELDGVKTRVDSYTMTVTTVTPEGIINKRPVDEQVAVNPDVRQDLLRRITSMYRASNNLPGNLNLDGVYNLLRTTTDEERTLDSSVLLFSKSSGELSVFTIQANPRTPGDFLIGYRLFTNKIHRSNVVKLYNYTGVTGTAIKNYYSRHGVTISSGVIYNILNDFAVTREEKIDFINQQLPQSDNNLLPVLDAQTVALVNTENPARSFKLGIDNRMKNYNLTAEEASRLTGRQITGPVTTANRRAPQPGQQAPAYWTQPSITGDINIPAFMDELGAGAEFRRIPARDLPKLNRVDGGEINVRADGGARRRDQLLGGSGRVVRALGIGTSRMYIIRLTNGQTIVSIKVYPGNREYLLIPRGNAYSLSSPAELMTVLRNQNLAEARKYIINSYLDTKPTNIEEVKELLRKHINNNK